MGHRPEERPLPERDGLYPCLPRPPSIQAKRVQGKKRPVAPGPGRQEGRKAGGRILRDDFQNPQGGRRGHDFCLLAGKDPLPAPPLSLCTQLPSWFLGPGQAPLFSMLLQLPTQELRNQKMSRSSSEEMLRTKMRLQDRGNVDREQRKGIQGDI